MNVDVVGVASEDDEIGVESGVTSIGRFVGDVVISNVELFSAVRLNAEVDDGSLLEVVNLGGFEDVIIKSE